MCVNYTQLGHLTEHGARLPYRTATKQGLELVLVVGLGWRSDLVVFPSMVVA